MMRLFWMQEIIHSAVIIYFYERSFSKRIRFKQNRENYVGADAVCLHGFGLLLIRGWQGDINEIGNMKRSD